MNDFTKDELENIRNMMFSAMGSSSLWRTNENNVLADKLQFLIDNYREQESCLIETDNPKEVLDFLSRNYREEII